MAPNRNTAHTNFIGPIKKEFETFTESAAVDVIIGYLRKYHLAEVDALIPQSVFQFPLSWGEKTFWGNDYSQEYTVDVIHDIYADEPTKFFDYLRTAIRHIKKEKANDSPEWDYLRIRLIEDDPISLSDIKPHMVNSPSCFEAVVIGIEPRVMYIKVGWYECPKGHTGKDVKCNKYKKLSPQKSLICSPK